MPRRFGFPFLLMATATACGAGWRRFDVVTPTSLPTRAQVQLWQGARVTVLHGVTIHADTLSGVPFTKPPDCDTCRVELWLGAVDSLRVGSKERGFFRSLGLAWLLMGAFVYLLRGIGGN